MPAVDAEGVDFDPRRTAADWLESHGPMTSFATAGKVLRGLGREIDQCIDLVDRGLFPRELDAGREKARLVALREHVRPQLAVLDAEDVGVEHGASAADWWQQEVLGGRATGDAVSTARRVLQGLEDGDPEILDALPGPRHGYGPAELEDDCEWVEPGSADVWAHARWEEVRPQLRAAYESAFHDALVRRVAEVCWDEVQNAEAQRLAGLAARAAWHPSAAHEGVGL